MDSSKAEAKLKRLRKEVNELKDIIRAMYWEHPYKLANDENYGKKLLEIIEEGYKA